MNIHRKFLSSFALLLGAVLLAGLASASAADKRCYEMRTYFAAPGKLDALHARFRDHTVKLFEKHGMVNIGYWVPQENPDSRLIYIIAYPSRDAREASWKAFQSDPVWKAAKAESEKDGTLVAKVESLFLETTDYSPLPAPSGGKELRAFELRTYTATPGKLDDLHARFRDHTVRLFEKHGMTNIGYWTPMKDQPGASDTLIYIIAHKSKEGAAAGFKAFGADPDWQAARKASEEKAGGSLTIKGGVKSLFMNPTDYSTIK
ncbi:MAG TPA: NIPSNAP family protein [Roseimicrobium sp.]|nr:NIPSNAP family protein [Roseimicrobium sp.]